MHLIQKNSIPLDSEVADIFYRCAGCLTCRAYCKHRIDVPKVIEEARKIAVESKVHPESLTRHLRTFSEHLNPYGPKLKEKLASLGLESKINASASTLYFIGCTTLFHFSDIATSATKILDRCGVDYAVFSGESLCCGTPALFSGDQKSFKAVAKANAEILNNYDRIVTNCPSCLAALKIKYEEHGVRIKSEILHFTELASEFIKSGRLKINSPFNESAMYHDPCHLAKYFGIHEQPRYILSKLFFPDKIIEFSWNRDKNYCCGGGGLLPVTLPKVSKTITNKRLEEFYEASPDMLVTACPTCERTFHKADPKIKVMDIISLLDEKTKD